MSPAWGKRLANRGQLSDKGCRQALSGSLLEGSCFAPSFCLFVYLPLVTRYTPARTVWGGRPSQCRQCRINSLSPEVWKPRYEP